MRTRLTTVALAALGLLAAACGGSDAGVVVGADAARTIAPAGAPYAFALPAGFTELSDVRADAGEGRPFARTGIAVAERDVVVVAAYRLAADVSTVSRSELQDELQAVVERVAAGQRVSGPTTETVAGVAAFVYVLDDPDAPGGPESSRSYWLFKGTTQLQVLCQSKTRPDDVARGCRTVLSTLTFTA